MGVSLIRFHFFEEFGVVFGVFLVSSPQFREFFLFFRLDYPHVLDYDGHVVSCHLPFAMKIDSGIVLCFRFYDLCSGLRVLQNCFYMRSSMREAKEGRAGLNDGYCG